MKIIILAGGIGTRLWPLSRTSAPKQTQPILGSSTLLQQTVHRLLKKFSRSDIFIVTGKEYRSSVLAQLPGFPKNNLILEPQRKNTAAAIGLAAYTLAKTYPKEIIVTVASDHHIGQEKIFLKSLKIMERVVQKNPKAVCLMGIKPSYPETGYGYIHVGKRAQNYKFAPVYKIKKFIEKPALPKATKMASSKNFLWNPSYFAWRLDWLQELYEKYIPRTHRLLKDTVNGKVKAFKKIDPQAIEYAVLEKLRSDFFVLPTTFQWADVGHWASVKEIRAKRSSDNVTLGLQHAMDTSGSLLYNYTSRVLTTIGVKDLIIVQTEDGTLVCHKDRAQDVKTLVQRMKSDKILKKFL